MDKPTLETLVQEYEQFCGGTQLDVRRMVNAWKLGFLEGGMLELGSSILKPTPTPTPVDKLFGLIYNVAAEYVRVLTSRTFEPAPLPENPFRLTPDIIRQAVWGSYDTQIQHLFYLDAVCVNAIFMGCLVAPCFRAHFCKCYWTQFIQTCLSADQLDLANLDAVWTSMEDDPDRYRQAPAYARMLDLCQFDTFMPHLDQSGLALDAASKKFYRFVWPRLKPLAQRVSESPAVETSFYGPADQLNRRIYRILTQAVRQQRQDPPTVELLEGGVRRRDFSQYAAMAPQDVPKPVPPGARWAMLAKLGRDLSSSAGDIVGSVGSIGAGLLSLDFSGLRCKTRFGSVAPPKVNKKYLGIGLTVGAILMGGYPQRTAAGLKDLGHAVQDQYDQLKNWWGAAPDNNKQIGSRIKTGAIKDLESGRVDEAHANNQTTITDSTTGVTVDLFQFATKLNLPDADMRVKQLEVEYLTCMNWKSTNGTEYMQPGCETIDGYYAALGRLDTDLQNGDIAADELNAFVGKNCVAAPSTFMPVLKAYADNVAVPLPFSDTVLCVVKSSNVMDGPYKIINSDNLARLVADYDAAGVHTERAATEHVCAFLNANRSDIGGANLPICNNAT